MNQGFYGVYMGNAGALGDLVYRGGPPQAMATPYDSSPPSLQLLAQGIPVGQDPRFPMDQKMFEAYVDERRIKNRFPNPGDLPREWRQYNQNYTPGGQASTPVGFDTKTVS